MPDTIPGVGEHRRLAAGADTVDATPGTYRTVGADGRSVTLLRVTDADGRRRHTGELLTVEHGDLSAFEPADDPDANQSLGATIRGQADGLYWQLRVFTSALARRPGLSALALATVVFGMFGGPFLQVPNWLFTVAIVGGSLALAVLGSNLL